MWHPISREELLEKMCGTLEGADDTVRVAWEHIRIEPEKWQCSPWGDAGGGFWVVAVKGGEVVWYNDIEDGFNTSPFTNRGTIGEYRCNQAEFSAILRALPEAIAAEGFADEGAAAEVPNEFAGPGRIVRRQTTFWELHAGAASLVRVHFSRKLETRFTNAEYDRVAIADEHHLLEPYRQQWASVFVTDAKRCGAAFSKDLAGRVHRATDGWRTAEEYRALGGSGVVAGGYGLLMRAPEPIAVIAADLLQAYGAVPSVVLEPAPSESLRRPGPLRALLLGRSFVVAEGFRFVRLK
jgi:hypothetical protein